MSALVARVPGGSENSEVVALRSTAGKDDFSWFGTKNARGPFAELVEKRSRFSSDVMDAGRITEHFAGNGSIAWRTFGSKGVVAL